MVTQKNKVNDEGHLRFWYCEIDKFTSGTRRIGGSALWQKK